MWRVVSLIVLSLLAAGCAIPIAWSTAPVSPLKHPREEGLEFYGGVRAGQPVQEEAVERFYASGFLGLVSQVKWLTYNLTAWGAIGRYLLYRAPSSYYGGYYDSIEAVRVRATAFHLQSDVGMSFLVGEMVRIESGAGFGIGTEQWRYSTLYPYSLEKDVPPIIFTGSSFVGINIGLSQKTAIGFRWHYAGAGTGLTASVRHGPVQFFASTQLIPLMLSASSNPRLANWTIGMMGYLSAKSR